MCVLACAGLREFTCACVRVSGVRECATQKHTRLQILCSFNVCIQHHIYININLLSFYTFGKCISATNLEILTQLLESGHCAIV